MYHSIRLEHINAALNYHLPITTHNTPTFCRDGGKRFASTMDLMLITLSPFKMPSADRNAHAPSVTNNPYSAQSIEAFKAQRHLLGLIVSNSSSGKIITLLNEINQSRKDNI